VRRHPVSTRRGREVLRVCGEHHPNAKLTNADVELVRELLDQGGLTWREIAEKFEVSRSLIAQIATYRARRSG
jgi:predicted transcriptional regulator